MAIKYTITDDDYVIYSNNGKRVKIYYPDILSIAFVARDWHGGQWSPSYSLSSSGEPDPEILRGTLREFNRIELDESELSEEDLENFQSALYDLEKIVDKIDTLED